MYFNRLDVSGVIDGGGAQPKLSRGSVGHNIMNLQCLHVPSYLCCKSVDVCKLKLHPSYHALLKAAWTWCACGILGGDIAVALEVAVKPADLQVVGTEIDKTNCRLLL